VGNQYAGKSYDVRFAHVEGIDTCIDCHDQHSLEINVDLCSICHEGVATHEDLKNIRLVGSASMRVRTRGIMPFTPRLLKATYNYQFSVKDHGAFAHNGKYVIQVLHDSLADLGVYMTGMVRP